MGSTVLMLVLMGAAFYFLLIRPQQKRAKKQAELVRSIEPGDDVLTNGGLYGTIATIDGQIAEMEIADGVVVRIQRAAVAELIQCDAGADDDEDQ